MRMLAACCVLWSCASGPKAGPTHPLAGAKQMVVVTSAGWSASEGRLLRFARAGATDDWHRVGDPVAVTLGAAGMGWGRGLHPAQRGGPTKQEGDKRSPAGVFRLSGTFGFEPSGPSRMPYTTLSPTIECVDDPASKRYGVVVDRAGISNPDWKSSEKMRAVESYALGVVVDHNAWPQAQPGAGSCIFIHLAADPPQPTVGRAGRSAGAARRLAR
jgi:zinc D-Ala-D-Ala dipeptidase